ncbi:ribonuclease T [Alloalcanivorax xenomutans]|jgi:ribonuclease T|uniref:Ribonuclease T n=1 Tax=Alloalcanivorax xenomutans TaxID=1094342 RepID=A0A9Q3WA36_9GAMM|nr:ribonuclease T [Alloalcanivorax xenomutans]ERS13303.1 ribonuclease T [Alcanivorax sp. PN-3]MBA4721123.1 ribonuclease T [Alcanivorax sp.]ARB46598.1 ribonuclease T [Alloalcanivorax xenomutans]MCE7510972.1 ribonuclease T [Alloalcanivorax xenomutans]MCE7522502.1 ribonuclease T [Alloalcanivorax xenomutans]
MSEKHPSLALRFRGFLPVVVDVETGGFDARHDALLEIAAVLLEMDASGYLRPATRIHFHVDPFPGANIEQAALDFTGIDPSNPLRGAVAEDIALTGIFDPVRKAVKQNGCNRAVLVGHNSFFDQGFLNAASERNDVKRNPFHPFSSFDTAALAGLVYGQTVLAKACEAAGIRFSQREAHSALYDATRTAELFCSMVNRFRDLGGWPPPPPAKMPPTLARELD